MPHFGASDLRLHCLPMSHKKDARLIWVKMIDLPSKDADQPGHMLRLTGVFAVRMKKKHES